LVFEEIKEGEDEEEGAEDEGGMMRSNMITSTEARDKHESPRDASGGMMGEGYLPTMSGGAMSPNPASPIVFVDKQPSLSLLDGMKRDEKANANKASNRPSTRFEMAFAKR
jgi:hypothetical protein